MTRLHALYEAGELDGTTHEVYPALDRGSRDNYLYFTLAPAINFQRRSEGLWRAAARTFHDPETRFVFQPECVSKGKDKYRRALTKHGLALLTQKHTDIWFTICSTLHEQFGDDPRNLLAQCGQDVRKILAFLSKNKPRFPYLNGPKLSNYWLYILKQFTDVQLKNADEISIIPDLHVVRASVHLGLISHDEASPLRVAEAWKHLLAGTAFTASDLHAPLWRWSRRGFLPTLHDE
jgi:hypothetical protein